MKIENNLQYFSAIKHTAAKLEELGMAPDGERLRAALSISSLPGEILGEIREVLRTLDLSKLTDTMASEIEIEIAYVDSSLR